MIPFNIMDPERFTLQELYRMDIDSIVSDIPQAVREKIDPLISIPLLMCADNEPRKYYTNISEKCKELREQISEAYGHLPENLVESDMDKTITITATSQDGVYESMTVGFF